MSQSLTERYDDRIAGMLSCYDRLVITGTLPVVCYAAGMTGYLNAKGIRIFDYPEFAKTLRDRVRDRAASLAAEAGVTIEHIAKPHIRKEDVVARVLQQRGDHPGLVHIISAMEACDAYKPWHDKQTHKTFIRPDSGKCLHYYFYVQEATRGGRQDGAGDQLLRSCRQRPVARLAEPAESKTTESAFRRHFGRHRCSALGSTSPPPQQPPLDQPCDAQQQKHESHNQQHKRQCE